MQPAPEIMRLLSEIGLTRGLAENARQKLVDQSHFVEWEAKRRFRAEETGTDYLFLVDGHVACQEDGVTSILESYKGLSAPSPIFTKEAPDAVAVTLSPCLLLCIPVAALNAIRSEGLEAREIELDVTESHLLTELYELISGKRLELPVRPEVALKIQQLTSDPDAGASQLTEVIQRDGAISGGLLHAANSPLFRAAEPIRSVRDAVVRLGFQNTRMLTTNLALRQTFKARHAVTREAMQDVWVEGVLRSVFAYLLADSLDILHRERALLAGLIAGIGAVPIIGFVEQRDPDPRRETIDTLVAKLGGVTGMLVVNYWGLGEDLVAVAEHFGQWDYAAGQPDYASLAILAHWSVLHSEGKPHPAAETVAAFSTLGVALPSPGEGIAELAGRDREVASLKDMFSL